LGGNFGLPWRSNLTHQKKKKKTKKPSQKAEGTFYFIFIADFIQLISLLNLRFTGWLWANLLEKPGWENEKLAIGDLVFKQLQLPLFGQKQEN